MCEAFYLHIDYPSLKAKTERRGRELVSLLKASTVSIVREMSARVQLPISDWLNQLVGKRLITSNPSFNDYNGARVFHNSRETIVQIVPGPGLPKVLPPLLQLPAEIRLQILHLVLGDVQPDDWLSSHHGATPASVIFACKQLYIEGKKIALEVCTFKYEDLPESHRMIGQEYCVTCDYVVDR